MVKLVQDLTEIEKLKEGLDVLVVSYGGSASNSLVNALMKNGYRCRSKMFDRILCHCPSYINLGIPMIYLYDNPIKALLSMKRRGKGIWKINQKKLSNNQNSKISDENLMELMIKQFNSWKGYSDVLYIKTSELFDVKIKEKLEKYLGKNLNHFPLNYKEKKNYYGEFDGNICYVFEKYMKEIKEINKI